MKLVKDEIVPIPSLPTQIIEAIDSDQLAIFIGAGASMSIGCSSWERLAESLVERCFVTPKKDDTASNCINFKEREALLKMKDPKKIITICEYILQKNGSGDDFFNEIERSLDVKPELVKKQNLYNELNGLHGLFITTNIDEHFDKKFVPSQIVIQKGAFNPSEIDRTKLYHIHGSITNRDTLVITIKQYFDRYMKDNQFQAFLSEIFEKYVVLFIGYGLNEFEVLDFLITKSRASSAGNPKRFILLPYYSGEETILEFEKHYFIQMGITVIPYRKDERGFGQLFHIIQSWNKEILQTSRFLYDTFEELKNAALKYDPRQEGKVLQLIKSEKSLEFEFFKQLAQSDNAYTWLKPLVKHGYFNPRNNPDAERGYGHYWNVMGFLESIAKANRELPQKEVTDEIIAIINSIIAYRDESNQRVVNALTDRSIIQVAFSLPSTMIQENYFEFINICLHSQYDPVLVAGEIGDSILPNLIEGGESDLILKILDIILDFRKAESGDFEQYSSQIDLYYLDTILQKYTGSIIQICGLEAVDCAIQKIEEIAVDDPSQFNEVWIPSIAAKSEIDRYDSQLIQFVWAGFTSSGALQIKERTKKLLQKEHPIFKRIAICAIDVNYNELKGLFWDWFVNPLDVYHFKHELYDFFKNHSKEFSKMEIETIIKWIETMSYHQDRLSDDESVQEQYLAYRKKEWLSSLLDSDDPKVLALYNRYHSINPAELHHPGRNFVIEHFSGFDSPISKEGLLLKTNKEIVQYLNDFSEDGLAGSMISARSLCDVLRSCVVENPLRFVQNLEPFLELKRPYQHAILNGLSEAWRAEKDFEWREIFQFINAIIESETFWSETYPDGRSNYQNWIVSIIAELIEEGTVKDNRLFDLALLPEAEKVLLVLAKKDKSELFNMGDLTTSVLNSSKGKIYSAMVNYSLCYGRHYRKEANVRWPEPIKEYFSIRLDPEIEPSIEFFETLGKYLMNLCYLDSNWVKDNINRIFPENNEIHWRAAFTGYLFYSKVYTKIFHLLKINGHYSKAIITNFEDPHINEHLVQHICIGYIEGLEDLDDQGLINQMLEFWNSKQITEFIRFLRWYGKKLSPEKRQKIIPLWRALFTKASQNLGLAENVSILSDLNQWISLIDELDEESYEWLRLSAKYIKPHAFDFIEQLVRHAEKKPKSAGNIFLSMLESEYYFYHHKEIIIKFVAMLYGKNEKKIADSICNHFLAAGFDFLMSTYEQNLSRCSA